MERYFNPKHPDAMYIMNEMNRYADEQQERWQKRLKDQGNDCAICLEPLPRHPWLGDQGQIYMLCCGNAICKECDTQRGEHIKKTNDQQMNNCILCREALPQFLGGNNEVPVYEDGSTELEKFQSWAKRGKGWANYNIGKRYDEGVDGCPLDRKKAVYHFELAAEQGCDKAMTDLAVTYIQGEGCAENFPAAKKWLEAAAKMDNAKALCYLGYFLSDTQFGFESDFPRVRKLFSRSAELGFPPAQEKLGLGYSKGHFGFEVDLTKAIHWFMQASEQGEVSSMMPLAITMMEKCEAEHGSLNVTGNSAMPVAINWMRRAGRLGDDVAKKRAKLTVDHLCSKACAHCGKPSLPLKQLKQCARCKVVFYCEASCQKANWMAGHKKDCCKFMG